MKVVSMAVSYSTLRRGYAALPGNLRGILLMAVATFLSTGMLVVIRFLGDELPIIEIVFFRYLFALFGLTPWLPRSGVIAVFRTRRRSLHVLRGGIAAVSTVAWYYGVTVIPFAEAVSLSFLTAIFVAVGAVLCFGEAAGTARWIAVCLGLVGALIILRPGFEAVTWGAIAVLFSTLSWSSVLLLLKALTRTDSSVSIVAYLYLINILIAFLPTLYVWQTPTLEHLMWFALLGLVAAVSHLAVAQAFKEADATAIIPVDFSRLIWAALLGLIIFSEIPDIWTLVGGVVILASTTYMAFNESRSKARLAKSKVAARPHR